MAMLFGILVLLGFIAMLISKLNPARAPEWIAWAFWLAAAVIWSLPVLTSAG